MKNLAKDLAMQEARGWRCGGLKQGLRMKGREDGVRDDISDRDARVSKRAFFYCFLSRFKTVRYKYRITST